MRKLGLDFICHRVYLAQCVPRSLSLSLSFSQTPKTDRVPAVEFESRSRGFISAAHLHVMRATATAGALGDHLSYLRDRRWAWPITRSPGTEISPI